MSQEKSDLSFNFEGTTCEIWGDAKEKEMAWCLPRASGAGSCRPVLSLVRAIAVLVPAGSLQLSGEGGRAPRLSRAKVEG